MRKAVAWVWMGALVLAQSACDSGSVTEILERPDATIAPPVELPQADADASQPQPLTEAGVGDASADGSDDAGLGACERAERAWADFLSTHQACEVDADCRIINDCGPHGDSFALNVAGLAEAAADELYDARCGLRGFDGFTTYVPRCREGSCAIGERYSCCGCALPDGGADGG